LVIDECSDYGGLYRPGYKEVYAELCGGARALMGAQALGWAQFLWGPGLLGGGLEKRERKKRKNEKRERKKKSVPVSECSLLCYVNQGSHGLQRSPGRLSTL
jgi:hypothetical protein